MPISRVDATAIVTIDRVDPALGEIGPGDSDLWSVNVGDMILCGDRLFHEVTARNMRAPERTDYVQITDGDRSLICCADHIVDDRRADAKPHTVVRPVHSGDLTIHGSDDYLANGFQVRSMLRRRSR